MQVYAGEAIDGGVFTYVSELFTLDQGLSGVNSGQLSRLADLDGDMDADYITTDAAGVWSRR